MSRRRRRRVSLFACFSCLFVGGWWERVGCSQLHCVLTVHWQTTTHTHTLSLSFINNLSEALDLTPSHAPISAAEFSFDWFPGSSIRSQSVIVQWISHDDPWISMIFQRISVPVSGTIVLFSNIWYTIYSTESFVAVESIWHCNRRVLNSSKMGPRETESNWWWWWSNQKYRSIGYWCLVWIVDQ